MVGGRSREPPPQYCRPSEPAIANHQTHHEVNNETSRRPVASDAGNREPELRHVTPVLWIVPSVQGLAGALAWSIGDPFRMNFTGSKNNRTYAVTT